MKFDPYLFSAGILSLLGLFGLAFCYEHPDKKGGRNVARIGVLLSLALVFGIVESFLPDIIVPGVRLGLANVVILFVLYVYGFKVGLGVALGKALLVSLLRGSFLSMGGLMALMGTLLSFFGMALLRALWKRCSPVGVSIFGSLLHIIGQILVGVLYVGTPIVGYLVYLLPIGFVTGAFIGVTVLFLLRQKSLLSYLKR